MASFHQWSPARRRSPVKKTTLSIRPWEALYRIKVSVRTFWREFCQAKIAAFIVYECPSAEDRAEGILLELTLPLLEQ